MAVAVAVAEGPASGSVRRLFYRDCDDIRYYRGFMWDMTAVTEYELQRVLTRRKFDRGFRLSLAEMPVARIARDRLIGMFQPGADQ
jgi:hypothetical protein